MAVARLDTPASSTSNSWSYSVGAGSDRMLVVVVGGEDATTVGTVSGVTYGGQSMTKAHERRNPGTRVLISVWYLLDAGIAAASGTTITASFTGWTPGSDEEVYSAGSYTGVNQSGGASTAIETNDAGTDSSTPNPQTAADVTEASGNMVLSASVDGSAGATATWHADLTEQIDTGTSGFVHSWADRLSSGSSEIQCECTWSTQNRAAQVSIEFAASNTPIIEAVATATATGTCSKPTGTASGDLLVAFYGYDSVARVTTVGSGFEAVGGWLGSGGTTLTVWAKVAGGSEPSEYTWGEEGGKAEKVTILRISGADGVVPMVRGSGDTGNSTVTWRSVTTDTDDCLIIAGVQVDGGNQLGAASAPANWTERSSIEDSDTNQWVMTRSLASAGTVPATTITIDSGEQWAAGMLAVYQTGDTPGDPADNVVTEYQVGNISTTTSFDAYIPDYFAANNDVAVHVWGSGSTSTQTVTPPTGWTEQGHHNSASGAALASVMTATLDGTETFDSESFTISASELDGTQTTILIRGLVYGGISADSDGTDSTLECPTVTVAANDLVLLVGVQQSDSDNLNYSFPSGYDGPQGGGFASTERVQHAFAYDVETSGGATGTQTITSGASDNWVAWSLYFTPPTPVIESVATANASDTVTKPTGTASGDLLVAFYGFDGVGRVDTVGSGFECCGGWVGAGGRTLTVWAKVAGGSEPANYTWGNETSNKAHITMFRISGADGVVPMVRGAGATSSTTVTWKSITTDTDDCLILAGAQVDGENEFTTTTAPSPWTEQSSIESTGTCQWTMSRSLATAGAVPAPSITIGSSEQYSVGMVAVYRTGVTPGTPADNVVTEIQMGIDVSDSTFEAFIPDYFVANNDVAVHVWGSGATASQTVTPPTGWTERGNHNSVSGAALASVMTATMDGTETFLSETFSISAAELEGTQTTILIRDLAYGGISADSDGTDSTLECSTVTVAANDLVLLVGVQQSASNRMDYTFPAGYDGPQGGGSGNSERVQHAVAYDIETSGGATGTQTITSGNGSDNWVAWSLHFTPPAAGPNPALLAPARIMRIAV
jgi:hypothetical protein